MKKYVKPLTAEIRVEFDNNIAIPFDPAQSTTDNLVKERDDEFDTNQKSSESDWSQGLW